MYIHTWYYSRGFVIFDSAKPRVRIFKVILIRKMFWHLKKLIPKTEANLSYRFYIDGTAKYNCINKSSSCSRFLNFKRSVKNLSIDYFGYNTLIIYLWDPLTTGDMFNSFYILFNQIKIKKVSFITLKTKSRVYTPCINWIDLAHVHDRATRTQLLWKKKNVSLT